MEYKNLNRTFLTIGITRVLTIVSNFAITSLLLKILGINSYGVYTAMFSLMTWMFLFDIGISKGMRNHLTVALVKNDIIKAKKLISTAYITTTVISLFFLSVILAFTWNGDIASYLNITDYSAKDVQVVFLIFIGIMFVKLVFGTINQILYAKHKSSVNSINELFINIIYLVFLTSCLILKLDNLIMITFFYGATLILSYSILTFWFFYNNIKLIPSINDYSKDLIKLIMGDGVKILIIQLLFFLFLGLDRFIILKYTGGEQVSNYDIMYKVMSLLLFPWSIIAQPLWSSYAEAFGRKDIEWIMKVYKRLILFFVAIIFGVFILSLSFDFITLIWLNMKLNVSFKMLMLTGSLILIIMWSTMHSDLLFGLSKYGVSIIAASIGVLIKVSILGWFLVHGNLNIPIIIISSIGGYSVFCVMAPITIYKTLKKGN